MEFPSRPSKGLRFRDRVARKDKMRFHIRYTFKRWRGDSSVRLCRSERAGCFVSALRRERGASRAERVRRAAVHPTRRKDTSPPSAAEQRGDH